MPILSKVFSFYVVSGRRRADIPERQVVFTATPIFLRDDINTSDYFNKFREEIDRITGPEVIVFLAKQVECGDADGVTRIFDRNSPDSSRFLKLKRSDLPCVWIEDDKGEAAVLKIDDVTNNTKQIFRILADEAKNASSAVDLKSRVEEAIRRDQRERNPFVVWLERSAMFNLPNDKVAITTGAAFVVTMLVIALFVPEPTGFQYFVFRSVLAVSAAGFATSIPGILNITLGTWLKAGGALAVLVLVYLINPASLVVK